MLDLRRRRAKHEPENKQAPSTEKKEIEKSSDSNPVSSSKKSKKKLKKAS